VSEQADEARLLVVGGAVEQLAAGHFQRIGRHAHIE